MKIAYLCPNLSRQGGGISAAVYSLAEALSEHTSVTPDIIGFEPPEPGVSSLSPRIVRALGLPLFPIAPFLGRILGTGGYDIVHTHGLWTWASVSAGDWAGQRRGSLIVSP